MKTAADHSPFHKQSRHFTRNPSIAKGTTELCTQCQHSFSPSTAFPGFESCRQASVNEVEVVQVQMGWRSYVRDGCAQIGRPLRPLTVDL